MTDRPTDNLPAAMPAPKATATPPPSLPERKKQGWWIAAALLVTVAIVTAAWLGLRGPLVTAVELQTAPLVRTLQFSARVATLSRVEVGSTLTARVAKVWVDEGAAVQQGQVLLQMDSEELSAVLAQARATADQARARLAGLRTTGRATANASVLQAQATLRAALAELARSQELVAQGFVSASRQDDAQRAADMARAGQASATAQAQANAETGSDVVQAQAQVAQADAAVSAALARVAQTWVRAPANARVLSRQVEPGQIVQPGKTLMSLALSGPTLLNAQVDERFLEQLQIGQSASVVADAFPEKRFAAHVLSIAPAIDAQRGAVEVKFSLDQAPLPFLREDMTLSVEVVTGQRERALVLPLAALRNPPSQADKSGAPATANSNPTVLVVVAGRVQVRSVRLGLRTLANAEVLEGLAAGDWVVLSGSAQANQKVRVKLQAVSAAVAAPGTPPDTAR